MKYIVKTRQLLGRGQPSWWRPLGQLEYTKWRTASQHDTLEEARTAQLQLPNGGTNDRGVFIKGRRLLNNEGEVF